MKRKRIKIFFTIIIILFLTLSLSRPSPQTFNKWLVDKYDIECIGDKCLYMNYQEKIVHRTIKDYILINKMGIILEDEEGRRTLIEGIGIFGTFIPFTFNPGYSPFIDIYKY
ncbi:hypothetical protein [Ornithinibacillus californiensis]|uniref:hypothetical protein n=1 Tax=Ornithinibacillus californiensis TaxID=161536 RepID=UPI00064D82AA|nr:hypothetical protein [Ornithinibacillus californiensis]